LSKNKPLIVNGWSIFAHPFFLDQLEALFFQVNRLRQQIPETYRKKNATKRLAAIAKLALEVIPQDPTRSEYRQGNTLGTKYKHWFRAKFFQQYRLFFRYRLENKIIVLTWVNDEDSKRACDSDTDAYQVFRKMLESGHPPDDWDLLLKEAQTGTHRLRKLVDDQKSGMEQTMDLKKEP
jgi:toxin YhaV